MHEYVTERFTDDERAILLRYFTNVDRPVFALRNLPEIVKGALFEGRCPRAHRPSHRDAAR